MGEKNIVVQPAGRTEDPGARLWQIWLAVLLLGGTLLSFWDSWVDLGISPVIPMCLSLVTMALTLAAGWLRERDRRLSMLQFLPLLVLLGMLTVGSPWRGAKAWIDLLIAGWNREQNAGVALFAGQASLSDCLSVACWCSILCAELIGWMLRRRRTPFCSSYAFFLIIVMLLGGYFRPLAAALLVGGILAYGVSGRSLWIPRRAVAAWSVFFVFLLGLSLLMPAGNLEGVAQFRERVAHDIHVLRYGEDLLPQGDLREADQLKTGNGTLMRIETGQKKALYLRSYVGTDYADGTFSPMAESAFVGDNAGLLNWLQRQGFQPQTQVATYYSLCGDTAPEENTVRIHVENGSRYALYLPASLENIRTGKMDRDEGTHSSGLLGSRRYGFTEISGSRPSELLVAESWVMEPVNADQSRYLQAEAVYRNFVYENDTTVDADLAELMNGIFWKDQEETGGIYSAVTRIREVLRDAVSYTERPAAAPEGEDPIRYFLTESKVGNEMLYAATAVEALRAYGIPARYAEGYYLSAEECRTGTAAVTASNAHAWVEVYFDGIGWMSIDVTPGYFYDTLSLQQMVALPDDIEKTSAAEQDEYDPNTLGDDPQNGTRRPEDGISASVWLRNALIRCLALLLVLPLLTLLAMEAVRELRIRWLKRAYRKGDKRRRIELLEKSIFRLLALRGVPASLGWQTEQVDRAVPEAVPEALPGEYIRVCQLLEQTIYGDMLPEPYEERTLLSFVQKLSNLPKNEPWRTRSKLRYMPLSI